MYIKNVHLYNIDGWVIDNTIEHTEFVRDASERLVYSLVSLVTYNN